MGYRVVIVGATGNVGREMLSILHERQVGQIRVLNPDFSIKKLVLLVRL